MAAPTHHTLVWFPIEYLDAATAAYTALADTGAPGTVFTSRFNASGNPNAPATHAGDGIHVGPEGLASLPLVKAAIPGSDYTPPVPTAECDFADEWASLEVAGLKAIQQGPS